MRIVTWNVNGIRRVHRQLINQGLKSFAEVLDYLEGDIICLQELKSERTLIDPIYVNVPGWRSYFSFPVDKKAYSGVAIYVRDFFKPIKVETAICGPQYNQYFDLDRSDLIGSYPVNISTIEARQVDREGRSVVLDFEGFILIGTYCPAGAESDDRVAYRQLWWRALNERLRNLIRDGREVILTGDLNVHCEAIDQVEADEEEYKPENLGPVGKTFHRLLNGSPSHGLEDEKHEDAPIPDLAPVFVDLSRHFHPEREKMFTCWSVRLAAREGNHGARIDFVLASNDLLKYAISSDTRPDIHGSDHCPVYAHFDLSASSQHLVVSQGSEDDLGEISNLKAQQTTLTATFFKKKDITPTSPSPVLEVTPKSSQKDLTSTKRKSVSGRESPNKMQKSIASFFNTPPDITNSSKEVSNLAAIPLAPMLGMQIRPENTRSHSIEKRIEVSNAFASLFTKPEIPLCTGHRMPAKLQKTKKKGPNQGREFFSCAQPLGLGQCDFWQWRKK